MVVIQLTLRGNADLAEEPAAIDSTEPQEHRLDPLVGGALNHISAHELGVRVVVGGLPDVPKFEGDLVGGHQVLLKHASRVSRTDGWRAATLWKLEPYGVARLDQTAEVVLQPRKAGQFYRLLERRLRGDPFRNEQHQHRGERSRAVNALAGRGNRGQAISSHI